MRIAAATIPFAGTVLSGAWLDELRLRMYDPVAIAIALGLTILGVIAIGSGRRRRRRTTAEFLDMLNEGGPRKVGGTLWFSANNRIYRVTKVDRGSGQVIGYVDDKDRRLTIDVNVSDIRRIALFGGPAVLLVIALTHFNQGHYDSIWPGWFHIPTTAAALSAVCLVWEFIYQRCWLWLPGAPVLEPSDEYLNRRAAEQQLVHGKARAAKLLEAWDASAGRGRRSAINDQEF